VFFFFISIYGLFYIYQYSYVQSPVGGNLPNSNNSDFAKYHVSSMNSSRN